VNPFRFLLALGLLALAPAPTLAQKAPAPVVLPGGDSKAPVSIDAAKLEYFDKEQKLVYSGGVVAKQGDATLRSTNLVIFLATSVLQGTSAASSSNGESQIRRMEAAGPVTILSKDQIGTGDRATYNREDNKFLLLGNVTLSQGGNIIKGKPESRLVYDLTTSQAVIEGGVNSLMTPGSGEDPAPKPRQAAPAPARPARTP
jgi:lipopolysaccharide export system protein LptA